MEYKALNNGLKMPMVGLGVYNIPERETQRVVEDAISVGYRSIDTAAMYYNEQGVGDAVRACGIPREELFITTKTCDSCYSREDTLRSVEHSMRLLGLDLREIRLLDTGRNVTGWPSDALKYNPENICYRYKNDEKRHGDIVSGLI